MIIRDTTDGYFRITDTHLEELSGRPRWYKRSGVFRRIRLDSLSLALREDRYVYGQSAIWLSGVVWQPVRWMAQFSTTDGSVFIGCKHFTHLDAVKLIRAVHKSAGIPFLD